MSEKEILYHYCSAYIQQRMDRIQEEINMAQSSANEETKSSMGDKYETSRSMAQLDIERNRIQLNEAEKIRIVLQNIRSNQVTDRITSGSLVTTTKGVFYIAISLGRVKLEEKNYFIISSDSPIGKLLVGKHTGDVFLWQGQEHRITEIQ